MNLFYLPQFPERFFHLDSGVTAVDFSAAHPNLLAVSSYLELRLEQQLARFLDFLNGINVLRNS